MNKDIIVVGQGLAGTVLAFTLMKEGQRVQVIASDPGGSSSSVAAGIYNPVTGKKMIRTWHATELFPYLEKFYTEVEKTLNRKILFPKPVYRPFLNFEEQNTWLAANEGDLMIDTSVPDSRYSEYIHNPYGGFETTVSGHVDVMGMLMQFRKFLHERESLTAETFDYSQLHFLPDEVEYKNFKASRIIFCEGIESVRNPWFSWLPLTPSKGELLTVRIQDFPEQVIFNRGVFVLPIGNQLYKVGSTYQWKFGTTEPTDQARREITEKLEALIRKPFEILDQKAGVRPSVNDRKPLAGIHPEKKQLGIFNGLGTKGVSLAPLFARELTDHILYQKQLTPEVNIERFYSLYSRSDI